MKFRSSALLIWLGLSASSLACRAVTSPPAVDADAAEVVAREEPQSTERTVLLAFLEPLPAWSGDAQKILAHPAFPEHAAYMEELAADGVLERGGPFSDLSGALLEFASDDPGEARRFLDEEPLHVAGVFSYTLRSWSIAVERPRDAR